MKRSNTTRTTLRLPVQLKRWIEEKSNEKGISENALILMAIEEKKAAEASHPLSDLVEQPIQKEIRT